MPLTSVKIHCDGGKGALEDTGRFVLGDEVYDFIAPKAISAGKFWWGATKRGFELSMVYAPPTPLDFHPGMLYLRHTYRMQEAQQNAEGVKALAHIGVVGIGALSGDRASQAEFDRITAGIADHFANMSAEEWGSLYTDAVFGAATGGSGSVRTVTQVGGRIAGRVFGRLTISSGRLTGNARAIAHGFGRLSSRQQGVLSQLPGYGSRVIVSKRRFQLRDMAALTAETGDEFAMFTTGGRRLVVRGDHRRVPIGIDEAQDLAQQGLEVVWSYASRGKSECASIFSW